MKRLFQNVAQASLIMEEQMAAPDNRKIRRPPEDLGLLEIARSRGALEDSTLPPGRRDDSGFWFPAAYRDPKELFTPQQRSMQAKQRQVQRHRRTSEAPSGEANECQVPLPPPLSDAAADPALPARPPRVRGAAEPARAR